MIHRNHVRNGTADGWNAVDPGYVLVRDRAGDLVAIHVTGVRDGSREEVDQLGADCARTAAAEAYADHRVSAGVLGSKEQVHLGEAQIELRRDGAGHGALGRIISHDLSRGKVPEVRDGYGLQHRDGRTSFRGGASISVGDRGRRGRDSQHQ